MSAATWALAITLLMGVIAALGAWYAPRAYCVAGAVLQRVGGAVWAFGVAMDDVRDTAKLKRRRALASVEK